MQRLTVGRSLAVFVSLTLLAGCDQRILGEFGYDGDSYTASYQADITIVWRGTVVRSKRNIDEFVQTLPPEKGYLSYRYNEYITLDADTVARVNIGHHGTLNVISYRDVYQRGTDAKGKAICRQLSFAELSGPQFQLSITITPLKRRPPSDMPPLEGIVYPPGEVACSAMIRAGLLNTDWRERPL